MNRPCCVETTALDAAYLAGLAVGYWKDMNDIINNSAIDRTFEPSIGDEERKKRTSKWKRAVTYAFNWAKD